MYLGEGINMHSISKAQIEQTLLTISQGPYEEFPSAQKHGTITMLQSLLQQDNMPDTERCTQNLVTALVVSKGWTHGYADAIVRDAIDRVQQGEAQPEPVAHMYPWDLERFATNETTAHAYSVAVGCPDGKSVPLFTHPPAPKLVTAGPHCAICGESLFAQAHQDLCVRTATAERSHYDLGTAHRVQRL